jgi:hypothetical protein
MLTMNKKQLKVLDAICQDPVRPNIEWRDVESFLTVLGANLSEGSGSRLRVRLNDVVGIFHRPHPKKEIGKGTVRALRKFLDAAGARDQS